MGAAQGCSLKFWNRGGFRIEVTKKPYLYQKTKKPNHITKKPYLPKTISEVTKKPYK